MIHLPVPLGDEILSLVNVSSVTGAEGALAGLLESRLRGGPAGRVHRVFRVDDTLLLVPACLAAIVDGATVTGGRNADPCLDVGSGPVPIGAAGSVSPQPFLVDGRPLLVLAGHIDTVPRGDSPEPMLRDGRVTGRGACDMKAGLAAMLQLAESLDPSEGFAHRAFVFYAGEEGPSAQNGLAALLAVQPWLRRAGLALLLEPTCGDLELGCSGSIQLAVTFHGKACHSARPWTGVHPLRHALPWLQAILARPIREAEMAGVVFREVITPTVLHSGDARNVVPGALSVNLNLRYPPDRTSEEAEELARSLFPPGTVFRRFGRRRSLSGPDFFEDAMEDSAPGVGGATAPSAAAGVGTAQPFAGEAVAISGGSPVGEEGSPGSITAELFSHSPAATIATDAPLYRHLLESTGLPRRAKQAWTDVARFCAVGVPALNWGPGDPELAHTREEFVDVAEAEQFVSRIRAYLVGAGPRA